MRDSDREVERVYLLDRMPEVRADAEVWQIEQGYLLPDGQGSPELPTEGRIRRIELPGGEIQWVHTIKKGLGLVREEREREISESEFQQLWPATRGRRIRKLRTRVAEGSLVWELDRFLDIELVLAEVELPDLRTQVEPPAWLKPRVVREVTEEPAYRNYALARALGLCGEAEEGDRR